MIDDGAANLSRSPQRLNGYRIQTLRRRIKALSSIRSFWSLSVVICFHSLLPESSTRKPRVVFQRKTNKRVSATRANDHIYIFELFNCACVCVHVYLNSYYTPTLSRIIRVVYHSLFLCMSIKLRGVCKRLRKSHRIYCVRMLMLAICI